MPALSSKVALVAMVLRATWTHAVMLCHGHTFSLHELHSRHGRMVARTSSGWTAVGWMHVRRSSDMMSFVIARQLSVGETPSPCIMPGWRWAYSRGSSRGRELYETEGGLPGTSMCLGRPSQMRLDRSNHCEHEGPLVSAAALLTAVQPSLKPKVSTILHGQVLHVEWRDGRARPRSVVACARCHTRGPQLVGTCAEALREA